MRLRPLAESWPQLRLCPPLNRPLSLQSAHLFHAHKPELAQFQ
ncbi:Uncharacterised protein [Vibrio cholerae]|nr:Uncharacterised protein [Vibrio cholerae]